MIKVGDTGRVFEKFTDLDGATRFTWLDAKVVAVSGHTFIVDTVSGTFYLDDPKDFVQ